MNYICDKSSCFFLSSKKEASWRLPLFFLTLFYIKGLKYLPPLITMNSADTANMKTAISTAI